MRETISIEGPDGSIPTVVLRPDGRDDVPALVVVPSVFGPAADLLERLAPVAEDAIVAVPDPFWRTGEGAVPYDDMDTAIGRLGEFDRAGCGREMAAVAEWARRQGNGRVVALGICFGGPYVLRLAAKGVVDGIVTWHGSRMEQSLDVVPDIACPVRHHLGGADPVTPPEVIETLRSAFATHDDAEIHVHEGSTHGFSHDGEAWDETAFRAGLASVVELLRIPVRLRVSGASHISFSVADLGRSLRWYQEVFGAEVVLDEPADHRHAAVLRLPGTDLLVGICQFHARDASHFDPTHTGLDHFAFSVETRDELDRWAARLDELGIDHSEPIEVPPGAILNLKDPDGIALALMWRR